MTIKQLKEMSNRIKSRRLELGFTQEQFSEIIGITSSSYTKIENAFQKPSVDTLIKISINLKISLDYLVFGNEKNKPKKITDLEKLGAVLDYADIEKLMHTREVLKKLAKAKEK